MRKGNVLAIAVIAFAIVGFLFVVDYAINDGRLPWSTKKTTPTNTTNTQVAQNINVGANTNSTTNTNSPTNAVSAANWIKYTAPTASYSFQYPAGLGNAEIQGMSYLGTLDGQKAQEWEANLAVIDTDKTTEVLYIYAPIADQVSLKDSIPTTWGDAKKYAKSSVSVNGTTFDKYVAIGTPDNYVSEGYAVTKFNRHYIISLMSNKLSLAQGIFATFTLTSPAASTDIISTTNKNLHTYTSYKLGVKFNYLSSADDKNGVLEEGNRIYVYYINGDGSSKPKDGQWVEVNTKEVNQTLNQAVSDKYLSGVPTTNCFVEAYPTVHGLSGKAIAAKIEFPHTGGLDDPSWNNRNKCPNAYTAFNGLSYFWSDGIHLDTFLFFSIGQYAISGTSIDKPWQETLTVL